MIKNNPRITIALKYALFAGTSTLLAFFLPSIIWIFFINASTIPIWAQLIIIFSSLAACLFHGYYRAKTLAADLGLAVKTAFLKYMLYLGFFLLIAAIATQL
jgi:hypothetical protein